MSKVGNAIKMYTLLFSRGKMKASELAEELEVNERMIRKYRDDLEQGGIYISSDTGKYGGYELDSRNYVINSNLSHDELIALDLLKKYLLHNDFLYGKEVLQIVDKLICNTKEQQLLKGDIDYFLKKTKTNCSMQEERKKLIKINEAISLRKKIKIEYSSIRSGASERIIRPYAIYEYKGDQYLAAFCEKKKEILDFKILRIRNLSIFEQKFEIPKGFSLKNVLSSCIGIYKDEEIDIELKIQYPMSQIVSEKIWVDNQKIEWLDDNSIMFRAKMRGKIEIISWILSMGCQAEVIKPLSLRKEIEDEIKNMEKMYKF